MKTASTLHILALAVCVVVQLGAPEVSRMPGVRRAIQTMEERAKAPSSKACKAASTAFSVLDSPGFCAVGGRTSGA
jgi:hypothetical protein